MKQLLALIIGLFSTAAAYADCAGNGLWLFPSGQSIKQNSIFVLTGYAESQHVIRGLNKKYPVYLKSGKKKIKLVVSEICVGQFYLTQAILKPETELEAGLEYIMHIDSLPKYESLTKYNRTTHKYEPLKYKVLTEKDTEKPQVSSSPRELKKTLVHYGCGPSIHVVFSNPAKDKSALLVRTTVKNLKTGRETTYYIEPGGDNFKVGHDMCSGAFDFEDSDNDFEAEFSFMDASGNLTAGTCERIKFTKPVKETGHDEQ